MSLPPNTLDYWRAELDGGRVSSRELTELALQAALNSCEAQATFIAVHATAARATADAIDTMRAAGVPLPVLAGIPISVKDLFDEAGQVTRAGSRVRNDAAPARQDSIVVERLRRAGAVIIGRTNMTEFAYSGLGLNPHYGTPRNPWDRETGRIPGGSSSGAAISVVEGAAVAAIGTDTGGSVRIPSALCGLTGFKPTASRVPGDGVLPLSTSLDSSGPLAHSVACCARIDAVLSGASREDLRPAELAHHRFAIPRTLAFDGIDAAVSAAFEAACASLSKAGASLVEIDVPEFAELAHINRQGGFIAAESWAWHEQMLGEREAEYDPRVAVRIRRGAAMSAADYITLLGERKRWSAGVGKRLAEAGCDAFLMPTVPVVAPPIAALRDSDELFTSTNLLMLRNPTLINFVDGCALSLPCHKPGDAPVGLMVAGLNGQDEQILALGAAVEAALLQAV
ncbi:amidase [Noviherbaspirillum malthae]|jgi:aspartyl-tRNA(Asn)/glutamyl-tRNA(Gln) amidotransferase subunit A|uniref:amidase n=1 Tax=Noviherbaspirillum malthae TaxID=1260987 RepID=UPI00188E8ABB|nr:amidase [Noviherbaspirillum malthae]